MTNILRYTKAAESHLLDLKSSPSNQRVLKDVIKALRLMEVNLRHPSLNTHEYHSFSGPKGEKYLNHMLNKKRLEHTESFGIMGQVGMKYQFSLYYHILIK